MAEKENTREQQQHHEKVKEKRLLPAFVNLRFEVGGKVQGVSFRKILRRKCSQMSVYGWVQNTSWDEGTVLGELQGTPSQIEAMKHFLKDGIHDFPKEKEKSKHLKITEHAFQETPISRLTFNSFLILDHFRLLKK